MMLEKHEYASNQGVYKPSKTKKILARKIKKRDKKQWFMWKSVLTVEVKYLFLIMKIQKNVKNAEKM